jgi:putative Mn2+ efflux pump MntP
MPVIGWLAGLGIQQFVHVWSKWLALLLLTGVGTRMIYEAVTSGEEERKSNDPSKGMTLVALSVATSIDALAVGMSLAMINVSVWFPALVIGLVASVFTLFGLFLGSKAGSAWGTKIEVAGGVILILIGIKIVFSGG